MALAVGIAVSLGSCAALLPERTCRDGWASKSIGRRGACSHHGGVGGNDGIRFLVSAGGIGAGVYVGLWVLGLGRRKTGKPDPERVPVAVDEHGIRRPPAAVQTAPASVAGAGAYATDDIGVLDRELEALEAAGEDTGGAFMCPECGSAEGEEGPMYNRIPAPGDPWSSVLSTHICGRCHAEIPSHLAERWKGISEREARTRWKRYRYSGHNAGKRYVHSRQASERTGKVDGSPFERPYRSQKIDTLEAIYAASIRNREELEVLATELSCRDRPRARTLLQRVRRAIEQLDAAP